MSEIQRQQLNNETFYVGEREKQNRLKTKGRTHQPTKRSQEVINAQNKCKSTNRDLAGNDTRNDLFLPRKARIIPPTQSCRFPYDFSIKNATFVIALTTSSNEILFYIANNNSSSSKRSAATCYTAVQQLNLVQPRMAICMWVAPSRIGAFRHRTGCANRPAQKSALLKIGGYHICTTKVLLNHVCKPLNGVRKEISQAPYRKINHPERFSATAKQSSSLPPHEPAANSFSTETPRRKGFDHQSNLIR